ncbi:MAG: addiction module protein [Verrucomicrobiota bacterium]
MVSLVMIAELFPELEKLDNEQKLILARELCEEAVSAVDESMPSEAVQIIRERVSHFMEHPDSGVSWEDLKKRVLEDG